MLEAIKSCYLMPFEMPWQDQPDEPANQFPSNHVFYLTRDAAFLETLRETKCRQFDAISKLRAKENRSRAGNSQFTINGKTYFMTLEEAMIRWLVENVETFGRDKGLSTLEKGFVICNGFSSRLIAPLTPMNGENAYDMIQSFMSELKRSIGTEYKPAGVIRCRRAEYVPQSRSLIVSVEDTDFCARRAKSFYPKDYATLLERIGSCERKRTLAS